MTSGPNRSRGLSYEPLTPLSYLRRAEVSHGDRLAVVDEDRRITYAEFADRARRIAGLVKARSGGYPAAVLLPNSSLMLEATFGIPWSGVPLVPMNHRLAPAELTYMIDHCEAGLIFCDESTLAKANEVASRVSRPLTVICEGPELETMLSEAEATEIWPEDEMGLLSINYTSGTTGKPKGVMYHHRGAFLQAAAMVGHSGLNPSSVHLWTLPMFHCHGWSFPWAVTGAAGRHVCLRRVDAGEIWDLIDRESVTHFEAAPTVLTMIAYADEAKTERNRTKIRVAVGGAPPSPDILTRMSSLGAEVTHLYGLTETFGPAAICDWRPEWDGLGVSEQAELKSRQGIGNMISVPLRVCGEDGTEVVWNGRQVGEICVRGNNVMLGYYKDPEATRQAAPDGWFRTGDLAVVHPDGYMEIRDRTKDVIISGGENISSVEVENAIVSHPSVREAAVVGWPDDHWGERVVAFVTVDPDVEVSEDAIQMHVREKIAGYKVPREIHFEELPKTATGKIQKFKLRDRGNAKVEHSGFPDTHGGEHR